MVIYLLDSPDFCSRHHNIYIQNIEYFNLYNNMYFKLKSTDTKLVVYFWLSKCCRVKMQNQCCRIEKLLYLQWYSDTGVW